MANVDVDKVKKRIDQIGAANGSDPAAANLVIECAANIVTRPVEWLVPDVFAVGKTSMVAGDPGVAKSTLMIDLIASVTAAPAFPWLGCRQGDVFILSAEDDCEDTIVPRLQSAGADLSHVHIIRAVFSLGEDDRPHRRTFNLSNDLELLEDALKKYPNTVLIVIDPISAYMGGVDSHVNTKVREVLAPVAELAARTRCAVIGVSHLNKGSGSNSISALYRIMGSLAFVAAVRSVIVVVKDDSDEEKKRRLFCSVKNNNAPEPEGALAYRVANEGGQPRIVWEKDRIDISAQQALDRPKDDRDKMIDAWLSAQLASGPKRASLIFDEAKALKFSVNRLKSSKGRIRALSDRIVPAPPEKPYWVWKPQPKADGSDL